MKRLADRGQRYTFFLYTFGEKRETTAQLLGRFFFGHKSTQPGERSRGHESGRGDHEGRVSRTTTPRTSGPTAPGTDREGQTHRRARESWPSRRRMRRMKLFGLIFACSLLGLIAAERSLVWEDTFDGDSLDETVWRLQTGNGCDQGWVASDD